MPAVRRESRRLFHRAEENAGLWAIPGSPSAMLLDAPAEPVMEREVAQAVVPIPQHERLVQQQTAWHEHADQKEEADQD